MVRITIDEVLRKKGKTKYWLIKEIELNFYTVTNLIKNKNTSINLVALLARYGDLSYQDFVIFSAYYDEKKNNNRSMSLS